MTGKLYGVGLGPGDPELMTLKAHRLIAAAQVIAYPTLETGDSFARRIAAGSIGEGTREIRIPVPMTHDRAPAQAAYDAGAKAIAAELDAGRDVVVLCEGDPFFYGSFMYLYARLADSYATEVVPGVNSITTCAAAAGHPLVARNEVFTVIPAPLPEDEIRKLIRDTQAAALMKLGRHLPKIRAILADMGLEQNAAYVERASLPEQVVLPLASAPETAPYFSMILVSKGADPWLT